mgnify:CR=1 FL=1
MIDGEDSTLEERIKKEAIRRKAINDFIDQLSKEQLEALRQIITLREDDKEYHYPSERIQSYYQDFIDTKLSEQQKKSLETAVQETENTDYTYKFVK